MRIVFVDHYFPAFRGFIDISLQFVPLTVGGTDDAEGGAAPATPKPEHE